MQQSKSGPDNEILNFGLELAMEWGENWLKPIQERLHAKYPGLSSEERDRLDVICREAMKFAYETVYRMAEASGKATSRTDFASVLGQRYPWIDRKNAEHLFSKGMYYAWKDFGF